MFAFTNRLQGRGIVVRTGDTTMIGSIAALASQTSNVETTMQVRSSYTRIC